MLSQLSLAVISFVSHVEQDSTLLGPLFYIVKLEFSYSFPFASIFSLDDILQMFIATLHVSWNHRGRLFTYFYCVKKLWLGVNFLSTFSLVTLSCHPILSICRYCHSSKVFWTWLTYLKSTFWPHYSITRNTHISYPYVHGYLNTTPFIRMNPSISIRLTRIYSHFLEVL